MKTIVISLRFGIFENNYSDVKMLNNNIQNMWQRIIASESSTIASIFDKSG
jgi:hypothetical protein